MKQKLLENRHASNIIMVVVCLENEVIFGMLIIMSISRLPTLEMHWSVNKVNFALQ